MSAGHRAYHGPDLSRTRNAGVSHFVSVNVSMFMTLLLAVGSTLEEFMAAAALKPLESSFVSMSRVITCSVLHHL